MRTASTEPRRAGRAEPTRTSGPTWRDKTWRDRPTAPRRPDEAGGRSGGTLYVVATPIGNLADVTLRALETLRNVPLIAAEDTRLTHRLLARHGIETRMTSYHARSDPSRAAALLDHLRGGADLALVTDAGTPTVSDPGSDLVAAWAAEGGIVVPIPGRIGGARGRRRRPALPVRAGRSRGSCRGPVASAASGSSGSSADERGTVIYEAPGRVAATLRDLAAACGAERPAAVCRELTKIHETIVRGSLGELAAAAADGTIPARGEFAVVVGAWSAGRRDAAGDAAATDAGLEAARRRGRAAGRRGRRPRRGCPSRMPRRPGCRVARLYGADRGRIASAGERSPEVSGTSHPRASSRSSVGSSCVATVALSVLAIVLDFGLHADPTILFVLSAAAILGLAWVVGLSTERLGAITGPQVGGILNATFGNIAELIIAFFALQAGLIEVVKASLTGSIIGNLLLVMGASVLVGGLRHGTQTFSEKIAGSQRRAARAGADRPVRAGDLRPDDRRSEPGHDHRGVGPRRRSC